MFPFISDFCENQTTRIRGDYSRLTFRRQLLTWKENKPILDPSGTTFTETSKLKVKIEWETFFCVHSIKRATVGLLTLDSSWPSRVGMCHNRNRCRDTFSRYAGCGEGDGTWVGARRGRGNKMVHFKAILCVNLDRRSERGVTVRRPPRLLRQVFFPVCCQSAASACCSQWQSLWRGGHAPACFSFFFFFFSTLFMQRQHSHWRFDWNWFGFLVSHRVLCLSTPQLPPPLSKRGSAAGTHSAHGSPREVSAFVLRYFFYFFFDSSNCCAHISTE